MMELIDGFLITKLKENGLQRWECPSTKLGRAGTYSLGRQPSSVFVGRDLSPDEVTTISSSMEALRRYLIHQQLLDICRFNHAEYEAEIDRLGTGYAANYNLNWDVANDMVVKVNLRILNLLSAIRTYLDHTETRLKRTYGKTSTQYQKFKDATAKAFDGHFSYRFIYKLRNYTQHCGMPLGRILTHSNLLNLQTAESLHAIDFYFERDNLLSQLDEWGAVVKGELQQMPPQFSVGPYLKETMSCLEAIDRVVQDDAAHELENALRDIEGILSDAGEGEGEVCMVTNISIEVDAPSGHPKANMNIQRLHTYVIEQTKAVVEQQRKRWQSKSSHERYAEGWDRIFGKK